MVIKTIRILGIVTVEGTAEEIRGAKRFVKKEIAEDLDDQFMNLPENENVVVKKHSVRVR